MECQMDDKKRAPDEKREAEDLADDKSRPAGPGQPVDVRKMPKDRRIFGNGDVERDGEDNG